MVQDETGVLAGLEVRIGHRFNDRRLLEEALTHRSFLNEAAGSGQRDNERLEFLGDAVLSFLISRRLLADYPESREGELSRLRAALVEEASLARLAEELGLGAALRLGRGEELTGGRNKRSLLADACEALLAAVYLDGGERAAAHLVDRHYTAMSRELKHAGNRDHKTAFQELAQSRRGLLPRYRLAGSEGPDHQRTFRMEVFLGEELMGEGTGRSKKEAQQEAARLGLARLRGEAGEQRP